MIRAMYRLQPVLGLIVMIAVLYLLSRDRKAIRWRIVLWGLGLQFLLAVFVLRTGTGQWLFDTLNDGFLAIMAASEEGAAFVFGPMATADHVPVGTMDETGAFEQTGATIARTGFNFAFRILPTIIFFSALMAVGYYIGLMQLIVRGFAKIMSVSMRTSGAETMATAANIFVGQTEAPLMVRPYVNKMTYSELMAIMVGGFANTAGGVLLMYVGLLQDRIPNIAAHLLTSSVMTGPAALMMAKLAIPETQTPETAGEVRIKLPKQDVNVIDAAVRGTREGLEMALNVGAMLIVFISLVALFDLGLGWVSVSVLGAEQPWTLALIFGKLFWPVAWLIGVPPQDCDVVGHLIGVKTFLNELVAYLELADRGGEISDRSYLIASYALCGFANIASIGIQIGGIGVLAPERRSELAKLGFRAMVVGAMATFSSACIVAILIP
jgi:CNT family concentrative nucleoside transporter